MISTGQVTGRWRNSKATSKGIAEFALEEVDNKLFISLTGVEGGFIPKTLGPIESVPHADSESAKECIAFQAETSKDGMTYFFAGNINKGLIIIATYVKVSDPDRANFFVREFFYKLK